LRALIKPNAKVRDLLLPHIEFAYINAPKKTMGMSPFKVVYGVDPLCPLDLVLRNLEEKLNVGASKTVK